MEIFNFLVLINCFNNQFYKELYKSVIYVTVLSENQFYLKEFTFYIILGLGLGLDLDLAFSVFRLIMSLLFC